MKKTVSVIGLGNRGTEYMGFLKYFHGTKAEIFALCDNRQTALPDIVLRLNMLTHKIFAYSDYAVIQVPTYPTGQIGMCVASDARDVRPQAGAVPAELQASLRYYGPDARAGAFLHPLFVDRLLEKARRS